MKKHGISVRKDSLRKPRRTWEDNIKMDLKDVVLRIHLSWDRDLWWALVNMAIKLWGFINCWKSSGAAELLADSPEGLSFMGLRRILLSLRGMKKTLGFK
jgi:hypothetical protein